jgi:hypothetical protein
MGSGAQVFAPPPGQRLGFVGAALAAGGLFVWSAWSASDLRMLVFTLLVPVIVLEGLRTRVVVDQERRLVRSTRAIRTRTVSFDEVAAVYVPAWGPLSLRLVAPAEPSFAQRWSPRGLVVLTGLYGHQQGAGNVARRLARAIGVPLESMWPQIRPF